MTVDDYVADIQDVIRAAMLALDADEYEEFAEKVIMALEGQL